MIVLLVAFGSVIAAGIPIGSAIFGIFVGLGLVTVMAGFTDVPSVSPLIATMIGIGVGIDYALFVAISGDTDGTSVTPAITVTSPSPMKMPKIAEPIGMPAAITEPNATSSTITAIASPIASLPSTSSTPRTISRDSSACSPRRRAISIASSAASPSAGPGGSTL